MTTTASRVDALVEAMWDMGRLDKARDIAAKHLKAAMAGARDETLADVERLVEAVAQTTDRDTLPVVFLAALREMRRTHQ